MEFTYKGLKAQYERYTITDADVDRQLQQMQQQNPRIAMVEDRPTQLGDEVVLDYAGFVGDEQFPGGTAENQTLTLGSGAFIPGFEEQLLDKVPGEDVVVNVTFPTEYHAPELAGKQAQFRCHIHAIRLVDPYELDDTFAKEVGGCDSLEQMRQKLREAMQDYTDKRGEMDLQDRLLRQAAETLSVNISDEALKDAVDQQLDTMKAQLSQQGLSLEMYCAFMGTDEETLRKEAEPQAINTIRCQQTILKVAQLENLEASPEEIGNALALIARENNMTVEQLKAYDSEQFQQAVRHSVLAQKVMELIRREAVIGE